jgi:hypothetical protein
MDLAQIEITDELSKQLEESIEGLLKQREAKLLESVETVISQKLTPQMQVKFLTLVEEKENAMKQKLSSQIKSLQESHKKELAALEESKNAELAQLQSDIDSYSEYVVEEHEAELSVVKDSAQKYGDYVLAESTKNIDSYVEYVVEQFVKDNEQRLVESVEYDKMKRVFESFRRTFGDISYELNGSPLVDGLKDKLQESEEMYNKLNKDYVVLKSNHEIAKKKLIQEDVFNKYSLSEAQKERVSKLAEQVNFGTIGEFETGLTLIIEEVTSKKEKTLVVDQKVNQMMINEDVPQRQTYNPMTLDESMMKYMDACDRLIPNK